MYLPGIWMSVYTGSERLMGWVGFWSPATDSGRSDVLGEGVWGGHCEARLTGLLQAQHRPHNSRSLQKQCGALRHSLSDVRKEACDLPSWSAPWDDGLL